MLVNKLHDGHFWLVLFKITLKKILLLFEVVEISSTWASFKFKKLSVQYKEALIFIAEELVEKDSYLEIKKIFKQLEKGV